MASVFAKASATPREKSPIVRYQLEAEDHAFMRTQPDGTKVPTGEEKPVAKLRGVHADGSLDKLAAWIWLDTPEAIVALIESMPDLYRKAIELRDLGWPSLAKPAPAPKAEAAPKPKGSVFTKAKAVEAEATAISNGKDPYADLPF